MNQLARRPAPARSPIDDYIAATSSQLDRAVASLVLIEPTTYDLGLAGRTIDRLIETLAGLAIGSIIGAVLAGVRRSFGADVIARIERAAARSIGAIGSPDVSPLHGLDAAPVRSLALETQQRLRRRAAASARDVRVMLDAIASAFDANERRVFEHMLGVIGGDPTLGERYTALVASGWVAATAMIEGGVVEASARVWSEWAARIAGRRAAPEPTQEQVAAAGFVMRIG